MASGGLRVEGTRGTEQQLALVRRAEEGRVVLENPQAATWHQGHTAGLEIGSTDPRDASWLPGQKRAVTNMASG